MRTSYGINRYIAASGLGDLLCSPSRKQTTQSVRGVIYHGSDGSTADLMNKTSAYGESLVRAIANAGFPVVTVDIETNGHQWGSSTSTLRTETARIYQQTAQPEVKQDKVMICGGSAGAAASIRYASVHPDKVAAIALFVPVISVMDIHDRNALSAASVIETAWGGTSNYNTTINTFNPSTRAPLLAGIPVRVWYSSDDPICLPGFVQPFIDAVGPSASKVNMGALGHAFNFGLNADVIEFLRQNA